MLIKVGFTFRSANTAQIAKCLQSANEKEYSMYSACSGKECATKKNTRWYRVRNYVEVF